MSTKDIIKNWMDTCCSTIEQYDHQGHMSQISKDVEVYGIPGFDEIGYDDWYSQCEYEFNEKLVSSSSYRGLNIKQEGESKIVFSTIEVVNATDGTIEEHGVEITLEKESDGQWRVTQERLFDNEEALKDGLPV